jgi:hypothetical protein
MITREQKKASAVTTELRELRALQMQQRMQEEALKQPPPPRRSPPKAAPAPPPPVAAVTAVPQEGEFWEHNFGSGVEKYERFPADLVNSYYVFHPKDGYMGLWDADMEELNPDVPDPTA